MQHCVHSSRDDADLLDNEVTGVENDTALDVAARSHGLHEGLRDGLLVGPQIVDQLVIGHANATVPNSDGGVDLVGDDLDVETELTLNLTWVSEGSYLLLSKASLALEMSADDADLVGSEVRE